MFLVLLMTFQRRHLVCSIKGSGSLSDVSPSHNWRNQAQRFTFAHANFCSHASGGRGAWTNSQKHRLTGTLSHFVGLVLTDTGLIQQVEPGAAPALRHSADGIRVALSVDAVPPAELGLSLRRQRHPNRLSVCKNTSTTTASKVQKRTARFDPRQL